MMPAPPSAKFEGFRKAIEEPTCCAALVVGLIATVDETKSTQTNADLTRNKRGRVRSLEVLLTFPPPTSIPALSHGVTR